MSTKENETIMSTEESKQLSEYAEQLNQIQVEIQSNDTLSVKHGKVALDLAVKAGTILNTAKDILDYGDWENWLAANVKGITERTAQNYMRLAKHVSVLADCESLGEAYRVVGVKKKVRLPAAETSEPAGDAATPPEKENTPEETGSSGEAQSQTRPEETRSVIVKRVRNDIETAGVNWDVATWTIKNGRPASNDATNQLAQTLGGLKNFLLNRQYTDLEREVEMEAKIIAVLNELVIAIIKANHPTPPSVSDSALDANPQPVQTAEPVAA